MRNSIRNLLLLFTQAVGKAVVNIRLTCAKTTYLYTSRLFLPKLVYKASRLYTAYPVLLSGFYHDQNRAFRSVNTVFLPTIHTTYKDKQKIINLFSY